MHVADAIVPILNANTNISRARSLPVSEASMLYDDTPRVRNAALPASSAKPYAA